MGQIPTGLSRAGAGLFVFGAGLTCRLQGEARWICRMPIAGAVCVSPEDSANRRGSRCGRTLLLPLACHWFSGDVSDRSLQMRVSGHSGHHQSSCIAVPAADQRWTALLPGEGHCGCVTASDCCSCRTACRFLSKLSESTPACGNGCGWQLATNRPRRFGSRPRQDEIDGHTVRAWCVPAGVHNADSDLPQRCEIELPIEEIPAHQRTILLAGCVCCRVGSGWFREDLW